MAIKIYLIREIYPICKITINKFNLMMSYNNYRRIRYYYYEGE